MGKKEIVRFDSIIRKTDHKICISNQDWMKLLRVYFWYFDVPEKKQIEVEQIRKFSLLTVNVWRRTPLNASTSKIKEVFVEIRIIFPLGLNFKCVHSNSPSHSYFNISKGPWKINHWNLCDYIEDWTYFFMVSNIV